MKSYRISITAFIKALLSILCLSGCTSENQNLNQDEIKIGLSISGTNNTKSKKHVKRKDLPAFNKDSYWLDPNVYTPEDKKKFLVGKILTALCCSFFLFGAIMFFVPDIKINNAYALLVYHCIAAVLSFIGIVFLMLAELKIKTRNKVSKLQLRKEDRASIKKVGVLAGLCRTVLVFSVSLIIVISIFVYISGWFESALRAIRILLK